MTIAFRCEFYEIEIMHDLRKQRCIILSSFDLLNSLHDLLHSGFRVLHFVPFYFFLTISFTIKTLQKSNLNTLWDCSDYRIRKVLRVFWII